MWWIELSKFYAFLAMPCVLKTGFSSYVSMRFCEVLKESQCNAEICTQYVKYQT
jgi:hypothetical protein